MVDGWMLDAESKPALGFCTEQWVLLTEVPTSISGE